MRQRFNTENYATKTLMVVVVGAGVKQQFYVMWHVRLCQRMQKGSKLKIYLTQILLIETATYNQYR